MVANKIKKAKQTLAYFFNLFARTCSVLTGRNKIAIKRTERAVRFKEPLQMGIVPFAYLMRLPTRYKVYLCSTHTPFLFHNITSIREDLATYL